MAISHAPGGHSLDVGALATAQHFGRHPEQAQAGPGPLHGAFVEAGAGGQSGVGGPAIAASAAVGEAGHGGRDGDECLFGDAARHLSADLGVVQIVGRGHGEMRPLGWAATPAGDADVGARAEVKGDEAARVRHLGAGHPAATSYGHHFGQRCGVDDPAPSRASAASAVRAGRFVRIVGGQMKKRGAQVWTCADTCTTVRPVWQDSPFWDVAYAPDIALRWQPGGKVVFGGGSAYSDVGSIRRPGPPSWSHRQGQSLLCRRGQARDSRAQ